MKKRILEWQPRDDELEWQAIRAQGAGGQNVNKVSSALHLRFDIRLSSLPDAVKQRLLQRADQRITRDGVLVVKAQRFRTLEKNRTDALERLHALVAEASRPVAARRVTRPSLSAKKKRTDQKTRRGQLKRLRRSLDD